ncbi:MAG: LysM peptidoglycan-binding domain-containing protein [Gemmatimonadetes bacterium]|nr:LysM peptidoglycan-binding domain-containing protein [Gemmatimonadota bacterium]
MRGRATSVAVALLFLGACGKRMPPPPPAPDYSPDAAPADRGQQPRTARPSGDRSRVFIPDPLPETETSGPVDAILASPWAVHDGIEERVGWWYEYWQTRGRASFTRYLTRMGRYAEFIDQELAIRGMPPSLRYLPIVEAGFWPTAVSPVGAGGLWQFMPPTARWLGLEVTTLVDERLDPYKATPVALEYLLSLNDQFGSWFLTLAAYNSGPGRVERVIRRYGGDAPRDDALFWRIRDRLPAETRDFVPKFLAAVRMGRDPGAFGFGDVVLDPPQRFEELEVDGAVSLDVLAAAAEADEETMEELNPHLVRGLTPAGSPTLVRVPAGRADRFNTRLAAVPPDRRVTFAEHRIASGETLSHVAVAYGVSVSELRAANPALEPRRIRVGTRVVIPRRGGVPVQVMAAASEPAAESGSGGRPAESRSSSGSVPGLVHVVSRGESLWIIARRYDVTIRQVREWNPELAADDQIFPGDELRVQEPGSFTYTIQRGDTIWDIAEAHGLSADALLQYNGMTVGAFIHPGDRVQIPPVGNR